MRTAFSDCTAINAETTVLNEEVNVVAGIVKTCVKENASTVQSQEEYTKKYNGLLASYENTAARMKELSVEKERKRSRERELRLLIESLKEQPLLLKEWDERLWQKSSTKQRSTGTDGLCSDSSVAERLR